MRTRTRRNGILFAGGKSRKFPSRGARGVLAGGGEVKDADDEGLVDPRQTDELINQRHRALLVIDALLTKNFDSSFSDFE